MDKRLMDRWHRMITSAAEAAMASHAGPPWLVDANWIADAIFMTGEDELIVGRPIGYDEVAPDHQASLSAVERVLERLPFMRELTPPADDLYVYRTWELEH